MNNFKVINTNTIIKDLEEENKKLKNKIKVLKSKVKTYEADINKRHKESPEAISLIQQSINNTKQ